MSRLLLMAFLLCRSLPATSQSAFLQVTPRAGEGLLALLRRYEVDAQAHKSAFIDLNKNKLGRRNSLKAGVSYRLRESWVQAGKTEIRTYSIFGQEHQTVTILNYKLEGAIFYIVPGHGGPDPGAVGKNERGKLCEDEYAYDVSLRLTKWLIERGALVYLITRDDNDGIRDATFLPCDKDEYAYLEGRIPINQKARLTQRSDIVNTLSKKNKAVPYQRMLSIHVDSRSNDENVDVYFYYHGHSRRGKALSQDILGTIRRKYREYQPGRAYRGSIKTGSDLFVIKNTKPPAVLIELGNIINKRDQQRILLPGNRQALAKWIGEGLYLNFTKNKQR